MRRRIEYFGSSYACVRAVRSWLRGLGILTVTAASLGPQRDL
jgi:hypothetical protein